MQTTDMKIKEFEAVLHLPRKLDQRIVNGEEVAQTLPPSSSRYAYPVDSYPACPDSWMNGSDIAGSYFVGVEEDKGMWLDFNGCQFFYRDVAIVISIQGVNPITGQKTDDLKLEQYKNKCPLHDIDFQQDNYCPECGFDWPDQNYLSTTGTPHGNFWLDGFRRPDGTVRQYIFTAEEMEGIASQIIGKDKVYAIGIAFYYSKKKKQISLGNIRSGRGSGLVNDYDPDYIGSSINCWNVAKDIKYGNAVNYSCDIKVDGGEMLSLSGATSCDGIDRNISETSMKYCGPSAGSIEPQSVAKNMLRSRKGVQSAGGDNLRSIIDDEPRASCSVDMTISPVKPVKKLEIGAGALIQQKVYRDPQDMDYWEEHPEGMLYVNYCDMETLNKILEAGEIQKKSEGFMDGLSVGS